MSASGISRVEARKSLRWRIVASILVTVAVALACVVLIARSVLLSAVTDSANNHVTQELEEFHQFASEGLDPSTGETFDTADSFLDYYLSRQIPDENELFIGRTNSGVIQHDLANLDERYQQPLAVDDPFFHEIFDTETHTGVYEHPDRGRAHWARVEFVLPSGETAQFAVANFAQENLTAASNQIRLLSLFSLLGLVAAGLIAWLVSGEILAPIRRLQAVASGISNSDLSKRVPVDREDEIGELAKTFNAMLDRIEVAYRDQRQFVDDAGHELRTPITVVRGQLELLESSPPEERARSIELATAELDRMSRMVDDLLTLAVADSGDFVSLRPVDVSDMVMDIEEKGTTISDRMRLVEIAEGTVMLDEQRITEAVLELYGNALRYSEEHIDLGSEFIGSGDQRLFRIWIRDRGMGVPQVKRDGIFSRFSRGEQTTTSRPTGAGLGLSIVQAIGQAHGGRAYVESTVGLGSVFGLEIPAPEQNPAHVSGELS